MQYNNDIGLEILEQIKQWDCYDFEGLAAFINEVWDDHGRVEFDNNQLHLATGGWSINEIIIESIPSLWKIFFEKVRISGGRYMFSRDSHSFRIPWPSEEK